MRLSPDFIWYNQGYTERVGFNRLAWKTKLRCGANKISGASLACPVTIDGTAVNWPRGAGDARQIEKALMAYHPSQKAA